MTYNEYMRQEDLDERKLNAWYKLEEDIDKLNGENMKLGGLEDRYKPAQSFENWDGTMQGFDLLKNEVFDL